MKRTWIGATIAAAALVAAGCSEGSNTARTFDVSGYVVGNTADTSDFGSDSCTFYDGTLSKGSPVVLRGANGDILVKGELSANTTSVGPACSFTFWISGVKAGESGYQIAVPPYDPVVVSEAELRKQPQFGLSVRSAMDVAIGNNRQAIRVASS